MMKEDLLTQQENMSGDTYPRIMLAAPASGSGKTLITCGILQALKNRGIRLSSFKCGPDYIDPMFHGRIMGISSKNLDTFFTGEEMTRYLFCREAKKAEFSVIEGVMGYYDGLAGISTDASAYDVAVVTKTPVVLIVDCKGMSVSITALIKGFLEMKENSQIVGAILNRMSAGLYPRIKEQIEKELSIKVLGYVPMVSEYVIESRHLGLVTPNEVEHLQEKLQGLAGILEETLDLDTLLSLGTAAPKLKRETPKLPTFSCEARIGVAMDEAFCFYYRDNLELLEDFGATLCYFSPIHDKELPENLDGLLFYGGYPELYAKALSDNKTMIASIRKNLDRGVPYLAECGGFMYLHQELEDMESNRYPMVGAIEGIAYRTKKLGRFGYITLEAEKEQLLGEKGMICKGHEFHYFDSTNNGEDFRATKPLAKRNWQCIHATEKSVAGFPHLYYYSNPEMIVSFLEKCKENTRTEKTKC